MKLLLLPLLLWCSIAEAQIRVTVRLESTITESLATSLVREAFKTIRRETGLRLRIKSSKPVFQLPESPNYPFGAAEFYSNYLKARGPTVLLVRRFVYGGQAPICGNFVVSSVVPWAFGLRRYPASYRAGVVRNLSHELGHMLGASHTNNGSLMDYGGKGINLSPQSIQEIYQCQSRQFNP